MKKISRTGDFKIPIRFFKVAKHDGPFPALTDRTEAFSALCEIYASSNKDLEFINTTNAKYTITVTLPNPRFDYIPSTDDVFKVFHELYEDVEFEVNHFELTSDDKNILKVVGVSYESS